MGDVLPTAMIALEKATGKTSKELMKMMEMGQLGAEYIKPFTEAIGDLAMANGAYDKALKTLGKTEDRFFTNLQDSAGVIGKSGFNDGLVSLYQGLIDTLQNSQHTLKELGKVFNVFFRAIKKGIDIILPPLKAIIRVFGTLTRTIEYLANNPMKAMELGILGIGAGLVMLYKKTGNLKAFGAAMTAAFKGPMTILLTIVALMDEIRAYFDADVIGLFDDPKMSKADRDKQAAERKGIWGIGQARASEGNFTKAVREKLGGGLVGGAVAGTTNALAGTGEYVLTNFSNMIKRAYDNGTAAALISGPSGAMTVIIPVMLNGREISREVVKDVSKQQAASMATSMPAGGQ